jgi:hypothetical protein
MILGQQWLDFIYYFSATYMGATGLYFTSKIPKLYDKVIESLAANPLEPAEQARLDLLLSSAKKTYNASLLVAGIALLMSGLNGSTTYTIPYGGISIPKDEAGIALYFLTVFLLIVTDRHFLMALPWIRMDSRRPPYDWVVLGLSFDSVIRLGLWFNIPLALSSFAAGVILGGTQTRVTLFASFQIFGLLLIYFPRGFYYLSYLIYEKLDDRGGRSTLSMYLLYRYRQIRQILMAFYTAYVLTLLVPAWNTDVSLTFLKIVAIPTIILVTVRLIAGIKRVYMWIDKFGPRFGFPIDSIHYPR